MKKILLSLILSLLACVCVVGLIACDDGQSPPPHTHSYVDEIIPPTCTEGGYTKHECSCGDFYSDTNVSALGHTEEVIPATVTCMSAGFTEGKKCSVCQEILVVPQQVEALAHTEEILEAVAPTCTKTGLSEGKKCSVCQSILVEQKEVEKAQHKFTNYVSNNDATYEQDGTKTAICDSEDCNATDTVTDIGSMLVHTHNYSTVITSPTCTEGGYTTYTCECGESYIADYVDAKHTFTKYVTNNDATDDSDGTKTAICDVDGCNGTETVLDEGSFFNGITFTDKGNYYSVTACDSQRTIVSLPSIYNGKPVTSIANNAFFGCSNLISVTIPDSVTSIGNYAFSNCGNLISVTMGDGVTSIGREAFNCCDSLISVNLSSSLTSLGSSAFYACNSLESLILPISLKSISAYAFYRCTNLMSIIFENTNGWKAGPLQFEATELEDHLVAAFYLKLDYCDYRWTRSDS